MLTKRRRYGIRTRGTGPDAGCARTRRADAAPLAGPVRVRRGARTVAAR
ncbi:MAG: hypothetical protein O9972_61020 [Burkholderiales bacterium]|nr:hypothetical protein [Burkholderiales bacterium]